MEEMLLKNLTVGQFIELATHLFMMFFMAGFMVVFLVNLVMDVIKDFYKWIEKKIDGKKKKIEVEDGKL